MTEFSDARWWKIDYHAHASVDYGKGANRQALRQIAPAVMDHDIYPNDEVCRVMGGGRGTFEKRRRLIFPEQSHV